MFKKFTLPLALPALLAACLGPGGDNSPDDQIVADALHETIIEAFPAYTVESGRRVLYACIDWRDRTRPQVYNLNAQYTENSNIYVASIMELMRTGARGACEAQQNAQNHPCACQIADETGRNMITVPQVVTAAGGESLTEGEKKKQ